MFGKVTAAILHGVVSPESGPWRGRGARNQSGSARDRLLAPHPTRSGSTPPARRLPREGEFLLDFYWTSST